MKLELEIAQPTIKVKKEVPDELIRKIILNRSYRLKEKEHRKLRDEIYAELKLLFKADEERIMDWSFETENLPPELHTLYEKIKASNQDFVSEVKCNPNAEIKNKIKNLIEGLQ